MTNQNQNAKQAKNESKEEPKNDGQVQAKDKKEKDKAAKEQEELSEEDKQLQEELNMLVERLQENDTSLYMPALESLRTMIRASTTSMTSVPKPLKFMRPHFETMKTIHANMTDKKVKGTCADVVSVLAMTMSDQRECLKYKLVGFSNDVGDWGHEYVRHLAGDIASEWTEPTESAEEGGTEQAREALVRLSAQLVAYLMEHNAEAEACDLLMEIERLDLLSQHVSKDTYQRVCLYLTSCVPYVPDPENTRQLHVALQLFRKFEQYPQALRIAMQLQDQALIQEIFFDCKDKSLQKQLAYMLARQGVFVDLNEDDHGDLVEIINNTDLNTNFLSLARELDIMEPKTPEDIYKSHLDNARPSFGANVDSARQNLAASFVNGLVNAGFGRDKLMTDDGNKWLYKNKEHGMMSAMASFGLVLLWDVDGGLTQIDKYLYSNEDFIKAGALLACGIVNSGVRNECDPALALLSDYLLHQNNLIRVGSILGLGIAYGGTNREDVLSILLPAMQDPKSNKEVVAVTALACGMIAVGSGNPDVAPAILQVIMDRATAGDTKDAYVKFLPLALGLIYLGKQEDAEVITCALEVCDEPFRSMATTMVEVCAYAGTGHVLKIQKLLHICSDHYEPEKAEDKKDDKKDDKKAAAKEDKAAKKEEPRPVDHSAQQSVAVLGLALISMGEDIGSDMMLRMFGHLLRYCEPCIRRAVPLALGLISVSNPKLSILDTLSKFSHDADQEVAHNAIFAMGLVGAGTNNARLAANLRQLAQYHARDPNNLFMVRIAQGLTHMGKGTLTLNPWHSDRALMSPVAVAGLMATLTAFLDVKSPNL
ncbi:LOW QUALITY PROTEIN: 26S proteasome non-ATPase regulatory subunit 2-like [Pollicipes pollicipes]|uniref:LOW QUALITY PROTEIN: 26S proteasome non-ATPase regulatory subunit 2-like n=1 Tax=Pollicipes pollicipes TaxID=41117 RepID=UPI001884ACBF|nr:LOW QUALITY PROTEIN: 26S proteasome non-ATPase regulatory subunit 2-like [Pollicipes pollicipes]